MKTGKLFCIPAFFLAMALAHVGIVLADEDSWSTNGPDGGFVEAIAIHPFDDQRLYAGTIYNGLWQTTDGGANWFLMDDDTLTSVGMVWHIKIDPFEPDIMYVGTGRGLFKSTDAGQSWLHLPTPRPTNPLWSLEINPGNPSIIYMGNLDGRRSTDGGWTWEDIDVPGSAYTINADPQNPNIVYVGTNRSQFGSAVYKSTDYGETWENIHNNMDQCAGVVHDIAITPADPEIIYLGQSDHNRVTNKCLYKSTNGGDYWIDVTPPGLISLNILDIEVSPFDPNTVFITTYLDGAFRSSDGGQTWEEINEGLISGFTKSLAIDPTIGILYLGASPSGIYRSTDNADNWERISNGLTEAYCSDIAANWLNSDTLYVAAQTRGVFMSTDGAESWKHVGISLPDPLLSTLSVEVDPYDPSYIYSTYFKRVSPPFMIGGGFSRSTDGGATWELLNEGLPNEEMYDIKVADYGEGVRRLFIGSRAGLFYSDDLGENWSLCPGLPSGVRFYAIDVSPVNPDLVFVGDYDSNDVFKSTDGGQSWEEITNNLPSYSSVKEIACDPWNPNTIYVSLSSECGLYKSTNGGQTWTETNNNLPRSDYYFIASGIAINPQDNNNIFVYSYRRGMFQSLDGGQNWEGFNEGLRINGITRATIFDPTNPNRLFMAHEANSVWEITRTPPPCTYIPGDVNHNGSPLELADVIAMIGIYRGSVDPYYICDCGIWGSDFAAEADPNGNCVPFELGDVVTEIGAYRGTTEASGCVDCPGSRR